MRFVAFEPLTEPSLIVALLRWWPAMLWWRRCLAVSAATNQRQGSLSELLLEFMIHVFPNDKQANLAGAVDAPMTFLFASVCQRRRATDQHRSAAPHR